MDINHLMNNLTNNNLTANERRQANKGRAGCVWLRCARRPQADLHSGPLLYYLILSVIFLIYSKCFSCQNQYFFRAYNYASKLRGSLNPRLNRLSCGLLHYYLFISKPLFILSLSLGPPPLLRSNE